MIEGLYTDAGIIQDGGPVRSRSSIGGSWCYVLVDSEGTRAMEKKGVIVPTKGKTITNNFSEMVAIILGMEYMIKNYSDWAGTIYSDSQVTLERVFGTYAMNGIPSGMVERIRHVRSQLSKVKYTLLQGHPTQADLLTGVGKKRGLPVSAHNVFCDKEALRVGNLYKGWVTGELWGSIKGYQIVTALQMEVIP